MQAILLSGGKGTRMNELTQTTPKPMVEIGSKPVLDHLINIFENFYEFEYLIAAGYKGQMIQEHYLKRDRVRVFDTGIETQTGGRIYNLRNEIQDKFLVTYGDGLANVNIKNLIEFHESHGKLATVTVTNPVSRFGLVEFDNEFSVKNFVEKPVLEGYVNIGFMVFEKAALEYFFEDCTLESEPLVELSKNRELKAFIHEGYFQPMDTYREFLQLNEYWDSGKIPWMDF
jgi:glucose-1-phosphate cytidylyltransferase